MMSETMNFNNTPSDNIYVGDLPADIDEARLGAVFGAYGTVKSSKILPGPGKCGALIRYTTTEEATWVVENLNGNIAQGLESPIKVNFARPPVGEGKGDRFSPYGGGGVGGKGCCGKGAMEPGSKGGAGPMAGGDGKGAG